MRLGVGAGFAGDRFEPAVDLVNEANLRALVFECLAERTIALAQLQLLSGVGSGFDRRILTRIERTLPSAQAHGTVIITNAGAANPMGAAVAVGQVATQLGRGCRLAVVQGDDVLDRLQLANSAILAASTSDTLDRYEGRIVSANAYLGSEPLVRALDAEPDVIITGRVADASLFLAPLRYTFGWEEDDWDRLASGVTVGHLLECAGQLTGGYFADANTKVVNGLARLGFPFADVVANGDATFSKLDGSGGRLDRATLLEQLLYEVSDPEAYLTPDVVVDMTRLDIVEGPGMDRVSVSGAVGRPRPPDLKVSVGIRDGYEAVAEISYAGLRCVERGRLAIKIIEERWADVLGYPDVSLDACIVGVNSCTPWEAPFRDDASEVRVRFAVRSLEQEAAVALVNDVEALYTNGPAGGGGVAVRIHETVGIVSTLIPRESVDCSVEILDV